MARSSTQTILPGSTSRQNSPSTRYKLPQNFANFSELVTIYGKEIDAASGILLFPSGAGGWGSA
jgi:hypothetical protein